MQSRRHILTAAAVMTWHTLALFAMTPNDALGRTVHRCTGAQGRVSYQAEPCADGPAVRGQAVHVGDTRTDDQVRQALDNRRREGFDKVLANRERSPSRSKSKGKSTKASDHARDGATSGRTARAQAPLQTNAGVQPSPSKVGAAGIARQRHSRARGSGPIALSSHRLGERPFEHIGTPPSDAHSPPPKRQKPEVSKPRKPTGHFTASTPSPPDQRRAGTYGPP